MHAGARGEQWSFTITLYLILETVSLTKSRAPAMSLSPLPMVLWLQGSMGLCLAFYVTAEDSNLGSIYDYTRSRLSHLAILTAQNSSIHNHQNCL